MLARNPDLSFLDDLNALGRVAVAAGLFFLVYVLLNEVLCYQQHVPGFAVPPVFPLVGNLHQLRTNAAEQYRKWANDFGDVYQVRLGNLPVIVINSAAAARVILGHNSQATASRPELYTYHKVGSCPLIGYPVSNAVYIPPAGLKHCRYNDWNSALQ